MCAIYRHDGVKKQPITDQYKNTWGMTVNKMVATCHKVVAETGVSLHI